MRSVRGWRVGVLALGLVGAFASGGCALYANYPSVGDDAAVNDPNVHPMPTVASVAVRGAVARYPLASERYVVNWPAGLELDRARRMSGEVGAGAVVVGGEPGWEELPVVHVTRVRIRGDRAEVEVLRPVGRTATETSGRYQPIVVRLNGARGPWRVESARAWPVGLSETPELFGWPAAGSASVEEGE